MNNLSTVKLLISPGDIYTDYGRTVLSYPSWILRTLSSLLQAHLVRVSHGLRTALSFVSVVILSTVTPILITDSNIVRFCRDFEYGEAHSDYGQQYCSFLSRFWVPWSPFWLRTATLYLYVVILSTVKPILRVGTHTYICILVQDVPSEWHVTIARRRP